MTDTITMLNPQTPNEEYLLNHPEILEGMEWGKPRLGHPEGQVKHHVRDVLQNVETFYGDTPFRWDLRMIALVHDSFKYKVDRTRNRTGENHHGMIARRFCERITDEFPIQPVFSSLTLDIIEMHDEAYASWRKWCRWGKQKAAEERLRRLLDRLDVHGPIGRRFYAAFYRCDNSMEAKDQENFRWFCKKVGIEHWVIGCESTDKEEEAQ